jgi:hypothetical protein
MTSGQRFALIGKNVLLVVLLKNLYSRKSQTLGVPRQSRVYLNKIKKVIVALKIDPYLSGMHMVCRKLY